MPSWLLELCYYYTIVQPSGLLLIELFKWVCSTPFGVRERVATFPAAPRSLDSPMEGNVHDDDNTIKMS